LIYKSDPPLSDQELQDLFADAWDGYEPLLPGTYCAEA